MRVRPKTNSHKTLGIKKKYVCVCSVIQLFRKARKAISLQMEKTAENVLKSLLEMGERLEMEKMSKLCSC